MRKISAIVNTGAGSVSSPDLCDKIAAICALHGVNARVVAASGSMIREAAIELRDQGYDVIAAGGGDGTISTVAAELVGHKAALGVLPLGTLNHFARDLKIPLVIEDAVALLCSGQARPVDIASVNGRVFINNSSLGIYPDQVRMRQRWQTTIGKWPALVIASLVALTRFRNLRVMARFNNSQIRRRCLMVLVSNNEYKFEPANLTERERLDSGKMGIYLLRDVGRTGLIRLAFHSLVYKLEEAASFESYVAEKAVIATRRKRIKVALDGEVYRMASPLYYEAIPGGLRVIVRPDVGFK